MLNIWTPSQVRLLTNNRSLLTQIDPEWEKNGRIERALKDRLEKDMSAIIRGNDTGKYGQITMDTDAIQKNLALGGVYLRTYAPAQHAAAFFEMYNNLLKAAVHHENQMREFSSVSVPALLQHARALSAQYPALTNYQVAAQYLEQTETLAEKNVGLYELQRPHRLSEEQRIAMCALEDTLAVKTLEAGSLQRAFNIWRDYVGDPEMVTHGVQLGESNVNDYLRMILEKGAGSTTPEQVAQRQEGAEATR